MSGDSPDSHGNEIFDFKEGRVSPGPTTSKEPAIEPAIQSTNVVQASVLVEPGKDREEGEKGEDAISSAILNNSSYSEGNRISEQDDTVRLDDLSDKKRDGDDKQKPNGGIDDLDSVRAPCQDPLKDKSVQEEEDDSCAVKCLYYTLQCCECVIV